MYSRNTWEKRHNTYNVPPGYDGSRFRRHRHNTDGNQSDEIILVPDSGFAPDADELSRSGIPTKKGLMRDRQSSAIAENAASDTADECGCDDDTLPTEDTKPHGKLSEILEKFGFGSAVSSDELLLCAVIFIIASDTEGGGRNAGDILLILALLLGIR